MALTYVFVKCKVISEPVLKARHHKHEIQYHLHSRLKVLAANGDEQNLDVAINVGINDADDLLKYKLVFDYQHSIIDTLKARPSGFADLTAVGVLPALDFLRSNVLDGTGPWRISDVMDGSDNGEPAASLKRLLQKAQASRADVYIFGRTYTEGDLGIHDVHFNQGSQSETFLNNGRDDHNDHNAIWQDGAVMVDLGQPEWAEYFTTFTQEIVPTDGLGNPVDAGHAINESDPGSLAPK